MWHYEAHRKRHELLYFWRLGFHPTYSRKAVQSKLRAALCKAEIRSVVCYELFGPYDLLLRVWLPPDGRYDDFKEFQELLLDELEPVDLSMCDPFQVSQLARHWVFPDVDGEMPKPSDDALEELTESKIAEVENGKASQAEISRLEGLNLLADMSASSETTDPDDPGIKFALVVSGDPRLTTKQHKQFLRTLTAELDAAKSIGQRSLYAGSGFGHFLILGRVTNDAFFDLGAALLDKINDANIHALYNGRTYTHISAQREYMIFEESLVSAIAIDGGHIGKAKRLTVSPFRRRPARSGVPEIDTDVLFAGRFDLKDVLGAGAFSVVYEGYDEVEEQLMAVKIFTSPSFDRVRREVAVMRSVQHPNVLQVYWTARTEDGLVYIASELVRGTTIQEFVDDPSKKLSDSESVEIALELLDALAAVHPDEQRIAELRGGEMSAQEFAELQSLQDAGFVHRDIKPGNMIRSDAGVLKLLDFNISSRVGDPVLTQSGTTPYQAPDASLDGWDVSTDLFASGVVLYQLLTQNHPYADMQPLVGTHPVDARVFRPELSPALANFLLKATAPLRDERFASASEMQHALASAWRQASLETESDQVGQRMASLRVEAGISIEQLAGTTGLERELIEEIELGASPTLSAVRVIARALNVSLSRLLGEEG
jgi:serine/threonine protein kinase